MLRKNHNIILNSLLFLGFLVYLLFAFNKRPSIAIISLILFLYLWILGRMYFETFSLKSLTNIIGSSGVLLSLTYFFIYAVEEVPYPEGAIVFHSQEIALSLIVFFISTTFLIYCSLQKSPTNKQVKSPPFINQSLKKTNKEEWEQATMDDLNSGNFEPL